MPTADVKAERSPFISFIKVIAIISIFFHHFGSYRDLWGYITIEEMNFFYGNAREIWDILYRTTRYGFISVNLFIFASGYGLTLSYLRKPVPWRDFYMRRFIRIFPLYWAAIGLQYFLDGSKDTASTIFHIFGMQALTGYYKDFSALWFVSVLVLMYFLFPLLLKVTQKLRVSLVILTALAGIYLNDIAALTGYSYDALNLFQYIPFFILGMAVARFHLAKPIKGEGAWPYVCIVISAVVLAWLSERMGVPGERMRVQYYYLMSIAFAGILYLPYMAIKRFRTVMRLVHWADYGTYWFFMMHYTYIVHVTAYLAERKLIKSVMITKHYSYYPSDLQMYLWSPVILVTGMALSIIVQGVYNKAVRRQRPQPNNADPS
ncbi:acyltransferase family protein [Nitrospirota bacterium]